MDFEIRPNRSRAQGRKRLVREREAYFRLVSQGVSSAEACRIVGVKEDRGRIWRREAESARPPSAVVPTAVSARFLSQDERLHIADRLRENTSVRQIARELGRSPSTLSRERKRNACPTTGAYRPYAAQARAEARRPRPKPRRTQTCPELRERLQTLLDQRWSPEQIARRLRRDHPDRPELHVSHETIYQALYIQGRGGLRRELTEALRTGRAVRRPRRQAQTRTPRFLSPMVSISQRPAEAADRAVPGHWEGDLIIGKDSRSAIGTLVERSTRYVMLLHLPGRHDAPSVRDALIDTARTLPSHLMRSLTWDQGSEMASHKAFSLATDIPVYFCDPASPWQRGSNENTNGLLRQYFPKGTDLAVHSPEHLATVAAQLNGRPRKTLGWDSPAERLARLLANSN